MDLPSLVCVAVFVAYIAWREKAHAVERQGLLSRRGSTPPALTASSRRQGKGAPVRVLSAEDDEGFAEWKAAQEAEEAD